MRMNLTEMAKMRGCSPALILKFVRAKNVAPVGRRGKAALYDADAEPLRSYLAKNAAAPAQSAVPPVAPASQKPPQRPAERPDKNTPLNSEILKILESKDEFADPSALLFSQSLTIAMQNDDAALLLQMVEKLTRERVRAELSKAELNLRQAKEQIAVERANLLKLETQIRRGEYIPLESLRTLVAKIAAVHSGQLHILGDKLADALVGVVKSGGGRDAVKRLLDEECYNVSANIVRELNAFLNS
jgi:hypothetical protein